MLEFKTRQQVCREEIDTAIGLAAPGPKASAVELLRHKHEAAIYTHAFNRGFALALGAVKLHGMPSKDCV